jgi:hypothetical protein
MDVITLPPIPAGSATMADAATLRRLALALPGTTEAPHFDRTAFRARTIFATLAPDGLSANLKLTPEEQEYRCTLISSAFAPVPGGWGRMGYTTVTLAAIDDDQLASALQSAWRRASTKPAPRRRKS